MPDMHESTVVVLTAGGAAALHAPYQQEAASGIELAVGEGMVWLSDLRLPRRVKVGGVACVPVSLDNGNDAAKVAVVAADGRLVTARIPTAFRTARRIRSGEREVTFTYGEMIYWVGETALRHEGSELPIGSTATRLADDRMRAFIGAALVEALHLAGFAPGAYTLALAVAIPDSEVEDGDDAKDLNRLSVRADTSKALMKYLRKQTLTVTREGKSGEQRWELTIGPMLTQPQTSGTINLYTKAPNGKTVIDRDRLIVLNIGGGDTFQSEVSTNPFQMSSERISAGTVEIARALWRGLGEQEQNDAAAQYALRTRRALIDGRWTDIGAQVDTVMREVGQTLTTRVLATVLTSRRFALITGGGLHQIGAQIDARMAEAQPPRVKGKSYDVINGNLSSVANALGALFTLLIATAARKGS